MDNNPVGGLPKWVVWGAVGVMVLALVLSRRASAASVGDSDPNAVGLAQAENERLAIRGGVANRLIESVFGAIQTRETAQATLESNRVAADAAARIAADNNRTQLSITQSNNFAARRIARTQAQGGGFWDWLGDAARDIVREIF